MNSHKERRVSTDYLPIIFETLLEHLFPFSGLVLLDDNGHLLQSSPKARKVCDSLNRDISETQHGCVHKEDEANLPSQIQVLYKALLESQSVFADKRIQLNDDIFLEDSIRIHLNAKWIQLGMEASNHVLITIEDLTETSHQRALSDSYQYHLTPREMEVWELYLQGLTYRQISEKLFIAINTVKKHMKSIYGKRRAELTYSTKAD